MIHRQMRGIVKRRQGWNAACTRIGFDDHVRQALAEMGNEKVIAQAQVDFAKRGIVAAQAQRLGQHQLQHDAIQAAYFCF